MRRKNAASVFAALLLGTALLFGTAHGTAESAPAMRYFMQHERNGMLEMISLQGNVVTDVNGRLKEHAHGMFSYLLPDSGEIAYLGGHLQSARISYTGEIVLDVVEDGFIGQQFDPVTGIDVWKLEGKA